MTDGINDGNELREPATEKQAIEKALGAGTARRDNSVRDHHRHVDSHRRANRGVFVNLEAISVKGGDEVWASGT